jgi:hypothetical protein
VRSTGASCSNSATFGVQSGSSHVQNHHHGQLAAHISLGFTCHLALGVDWWVTGTTGRANCACSTGSSLLAIRPPLYSQDGAGAAWGLGAEERGARPESPRARVFNKTPLIDRPLTDALQHATQRPVAS